MAQVSSPISVTLCLLIFTPVVWNVKACELSVIGGGCPDLKQCIETCRPCYRGVGKIVAYCRPGGVIFPFAQCICSMQNGAPCNPVGPPTCPRPWPPAATVDNNHTQPHNPIPTL